MVIQRKINAVYTIVISPILIPLLLIFRFEDFPEAWEEYWDLVRREWNDD